MGPVQGHQCPYDAPSVAEHFRKTGTVNLNPADVLLFRDSLSLQSEGYFDLQDADHPDHIHEARILEVFPTSFLAVLLSDADYAAISDRYPQGKIPRGKKSDEFWKKAVREGHLKQLVETLAPQKSLQTPLESIKDHDHRAAFICALAALCVARDQYVAVGDPEDGHIILPPPQFWGLGPSPRDHPWAEVTLRENINTVRKNVGNHAKAQILCNGMPWDWDALREDTP